MGILGWLVPLYLAVDWISDGKLNGKIGRRKLAQAKKTEEPKTKKGEEPQKKVVPEKEKPTLAESSSLEDKIKALREYYIRKDGKVGEKTEEALNKILENKQDGAANILCKQLGLFSEEKESEVVPKPAPIESKKPKPVLSPEKEQELKKLESDRAKCKEMLTRWGKYKTKLFTVKKTDAAKLAKNPKMYAHLTLWANQEIKKIDAEIQKKMKGSSKTSKPKVGKKEGYTTVQKAPRPDKKTLLEIKALKAKKARVIAYYRDRQKFLKEETVKCDKAIPYWKKELEAIEKELKEPNKSASEKNSPGQQQKPPPNIEMG